MKILIGVDGSADGFAAVQFVARLLDATRDQVVLYYSPPEVHTRGGPPDIRRRARAALAEAIFEEAREHLPEAFRTKAQTITGEKTARHGLILAADESRADLVVTGARGAGAMSRLLLGSVSHTVARGAHAPVLVVRRPNNAASPDSPLRILFAWDGSASSRDAAALACQLHCAADTRIVAITVVESLLAGAVPAWLEERARSADSEAMAQAWVREHDADKEHSRRELEKFCQGLPPPFRDAKLVVAEGHPADQILQTAAAEQSDLIVVGAHGASAFERMLIGSTSEKVLAHASCSVLVVRQRPHS